MSKNMVAWYLGYYKQYSIKILEHVIKDCDERIKDINAKKEACLQLIKEKKL